MAEMSIGFPGQSRQRYWHGRLSTCLMSVEHARASYALPFSWSVDRQAFQRGLLPAWYMRLRHILTGGAVFGLPVTHLHRH